MSSGRRLSATRHPVRYSRSDPSLELLRKGVTLGAQRAALGCCGQLLSCRNEHCLLDGNRFAMFDGARVPLPKSVLMTRVPSLDSYTISIDEIDATVNRCRLDKPGRSSSDVVLLSGKGNDIRVLVIKRAKAPFAGCHALPGGHIDEGETSRATAVRELREETSVEINASDLRYLKDYTGVERDPRAQARSSVYFHTLDAELPASASGRPFTHAGRAIPRPSDSARGV